MNENYTNEQKYSLMSFSKSFLTKPSESNKKLSRLFSGLSVGTYFFVNYIVSVVLSLIVSFVLYFIMAFVDINLDKANVLLSSILNSAIYIILFISLLPFLIRTLIEDFKKIYMKNFLIFSIIAFVIFLLIIMIYNSTIQEFLIRILIKTNILSSETVEAYSESANQQSINEMLINPVSAIVSIPFIVILGPVTEELVFRKAFFRLLNFKNNIFNIIITAFLFGLIHVSSAILLNFTQIFQGNIQYGIETTILEIVYLGSYCLPGLLLGLIYAITGHNIYPVMLVHIFNNLLAVILTYAQM